MARSFRLKLIIPLEEVWNSCYTSYILPHYLSYVYGLLVRCLLIFEIRLPITNTCLNMRGIFDSY